MGVDDPGYVNKRNQNPSWCDRVLWHSRVGIESDVRQNEYSGVFACTQSDHRPVHASFLVRTRLPFVLNSEAVRGRFTAFGRCELLFEDLKFVQTSTPDSDDVTGALELAVGGSQADTRSADALRVSYRWRR